MALQKVRLRRDFLPDIEKFAQGLGRIFENVGSLGRKNPVNLIGQQIAGPAQQPFPAAIAGGAAAAIAPALHPMMATPARIIVDAYPAARWVLPKIVRRKSQGHTGCPYR